MLHRNIFALAALAAAGCAHPINGADDLAACGDAECGAGCATDGDCGKGLKCSPTTHTCVACVSDKDCPAGEVCNGATHACGRGCNAMKGCGDAGLCELDAGACVECARDADCKDPKSPRCDPAQLKCVPCLPSSDNCGKGQFCSQSGTSYNCAPGCKDDSDCGSGQKCDKTQHKCVECTQDTDCPLGQTCHSGTCAPGCSNTQKCNAALTCCKMLCVDTQSDWQNCGQCGQTCMNGWNCCGAQCSNPALDANNCGGCGIVCKAANGVAACKLRVCTIASCNPGWADCNGALLDGCETNTDSNVGNCGGCNNPCSLPNASPKCVGGKCQVAACALGFGDCNMMAADGCETNIFMDAKNCGGCGMACNVPHATAKCQGGACSIGSCDPGFADCNNNPADGCEVDLTTDIKNCGKCGTVCSGNNGIPSCQNSVCTIGCGAGFADCNNNPADGCEVNTMTDPTHCGSCNNNCAGNLPPHVAQAGCSGGACTIGQCQGGFFDVDGNQGDGCECQTDAFGAACGNATPIGQLGIGQSATETGNIVPAGKENWFSVTFAGDHASKQFHAQAALTTNPNNAFRLDVYADCAGNTVACGDGNSTGLTQWEYYWGDQNSGAYNAIPAFGNANTVYIRVRRVQGAVTCDNYVLTVSD